MRTALARSVLCLALMLTPTAAALSGCAALGISGSVSGASTTEQVNLRLIQAADVTQAAYATAQQQLAKGVITPAEATKAKATIDKAAAAITTASAAVSGGVANTPQLLAAMDAAILMVLRAQAAGPK